ncbi:MAG: leucine-rich repeat domain-containing protein [Mycoplasmataceae bacterium]|nr:leucine-rich repeat domain-containing protein [Mycoplasmataceae bacterium]
MKKTNKFLLNTCASSIVVVAGGAVVATTATSCAQKNNDIDISIKNGSDILSYSEDLNPRHTQHECEIEITSKSHTDMIVTWNKINGVDAYLTVLNVNYGDSIKSGTRIIVRYDKKEVSEGHNVAFILNFKNSKEDRQFKITLINDQINPIPYDLFEWSPVSGTNQLWTMNGLVQGAELSTYDTILVPTDVTEIKANAFKNLPKNIINLVFVDSQESDRNSVFSQIGSNAFNGAQLVNIELPGSIKRIGTNAFANIDTIGTSDFTPFDHLQPGAHIYLESGLGNYKLVNFYKDNDPNKNIVGQIIVPNNGLTNTSVSLSDSPQGLVWGKVIIDNQGNSAILSSTEIADDAFNGAQSITDIEVNASLTYLGSRAFANLLIHDHEFINFNFTEIPQTIGFNVTENTFTTTAPTTINLMNVSERQLANNWSYATQSKFNVMAPNVNSETTLTLTDFAGDVFTKTLRYGDDGSDEIFTIGYITDLGQATQNKNDIPVNDNKWQGQYRFGSPYIQMSTVNYFAQLSEVGREVTIKAVLMDKYEHDSDANITYTVTGTDWQNYCEFSSETKILKVTNLPSTALDVTITATLADLSSSLKFKVFDGTTSNLPVDMKLSDGIYSIGYGSGGKTISVTKPAELSLQYAVDQPNIAHIDSSGSLPTLVADKGITEPTDLVVSAKDTDGNILASIIVKIFVVVPGLSWQTSLVQDKGYVMDFVWAKHNSVNLEHFNGTFNLTLSLVDLHDPTIYSVHSFVITTTDQ